MAAASWTLVIRYLPREEIYHTMEEHWQLLDFYPLPLILCTKVPIGLSCLHLIQIFLLYMLLNQNPPGIPVPVLAS